MAYTDEKLKTKMLFYRLIGLKNSFIDLESDNYKNFVRDELGEIINNNASTENAYQIVYNYYKFLISAEYSEIKYLLGFFKKYNLMDFEIDYPDVVKYIFDENLTQQDIYDAYEKELAYVNKKTPVKNEQKSLNPTIFERLDKFTTIEERQAHIHELARNYEDSLRLTMQENNYNNFIMDREKGLYRVLENALYKYDGKKFIFEYNPLNINFECIKEFCDKYGIVIKMIDRGETISKDYLPSIKTIEDIRELFNYYFMELQQIERFSKSEKELWEECNEFVTNNEDWLKERQASR